ncbi:ribosome biogenesis GTPase [Albidovulum inexpectatum]|uniref:Small ribosomal subunit biogenesis GTPase RsgA n=1 Tax=Albidovulum inexpectatum TaxID=196587 RepID=A0A2S5JLR5_9RHOB|nr:ribosome small subunit-dependent GTPase A [Albidovulum inexpectatum]PPB82185.1 ribosome biogenesis GTPase [Albidovulum inexpectatum]
MTAQPPSLIDMGWGDDLAAHLSTDEAARLHPARVIGVNRDRIDALGPQGAVTLFLPPDLPAGELAVGDWIVYAPETQRVERVLPRRSRIFRRAAGDGTREQLIVANVDTLFIVSSCTLEFNEARIERYLVLANAGGVPPVLVLTKADMCPDPRRYLDRLAAIAPGVPAMAVNAKAPDVAGRLREWCGPGQTVAFIGMSGVGKSTLASALTGLRIEIGAVREEDMRGRHTTTARRMYPVPGGGWLIDTPGMREIRLGGMAQAIDATFPEILQAARNCHFSDCMHGPEPGCAVQEAVASGQVDPARLERWRKLREEDAEVAKSVPPRIRRERAESTKRAARPTPRRPRSG